MPIAQIHLNGVVKNIAPDAARPKPRRGIAWLDVSAPTEDDLSCLARTYKFRSLTIEACCNFNQRAKIESYGDYLFLSLATTIRENTELHPRELEAFLGGDYLVTVHRETVPALDVARKHSNANTRPDFLLYLIADHMVDVYFPTLDEMDDEIDALEDQILENATPATMHSIFGLKQQLVFLRKVTAPMRDVMNTLAGTRYGLVDEHTALYFRDVYDHLVRIYDLIETSRDLLGNALDAYLSTVSNRLNEVMKRLTLIATVFMPISFLVGFAGMNFTQMPFSDPTAFRVMISLIALVPAAMLVWFRRSKWV